jgi:hypothetical protein
MAHEPGRQPEPEYDPDEMGTGSEEEESASPLPERLSGARLIGHTLEGRYQFDELVGRHSPAF